MVIHQDKMNTTTHQMSSLFPPEEEIRPKSRARRFSIKLRGNKMYLMLLHSIPDVIFFLAGLATFLGVESANKMIQLFFELASEFSWLVHYKHFI